MMVTTEGSKQQLSKFYYIIYTAAIEAVAVSIRGISLSPPWDISNGKHLRLLVSTVASRLLDHSQMKYEIWPAIQF
jgi:hypothetical protein